MLKTLGIVRASFHLPRFRSNIMRRLGGRSLLEWVVRRATDAMRLNGVIVLVGRGEELRDVGRFVPSDVPICTVDGDDELARFAKALEQFPAESAVHIGGDNLFIDPSLIDRLVNTADSDRDCDYASYCSRDGRPAMFSPVGVYAEWFKAEALQRANRLASAVEDRRTVSSYFRLHPKEFNSQLIAAPAEIDREDVRLTLDIEEDWDHALAILDALGSEWLDWRKIARLLDHQPALRNRMAALNRQRREAVTI